MVVPWCERRQTFFEADGADGGYGDSHDMDIRSLLSGWARMTTIYDDIHGQDDDDGDDDDDVDGEEETSNDVDNEDEDE